MPIPFTDEFTNTNGTAIATHNSDYVVDDGGAQIQSNAVRSDDGGQTFVRYTGGAFNDDQVVDGDWIGNDSDGSKYGMLTVRGTVAGPNIDNYAVWSNGASISNLSRVDNGAFNELDVGAAWANGDKITIKVEGTTISGLIDDVGDTTAIDSTYTSGDPGLAFFGGASANAQFTAITFDNLAAGSVDDLLADDVESTSEVTAPSIDQTHVLLADDIQSLSQVDSPAAGQEHVLLAADVESTSEVSSPAISESHILLADDIQSISEVSAPSIGQVHIFNATDVESLSEVSNPVTGQEHTLLADNTESASEVTIPVIGQEHILLADDIESASEVSNPTASESNILLADDIESASEITTPVIGQVHIIDAANVQSLSELTAPIIGQLHIILADDVQSLSQVSIPVIFSAEPFQWEEQCPDDIVWFEQIAASDSWSESAKDDIAWEKQDPATIDIKRCA